MPSLTPPPKMQFFDANGNPLSGGKVYTYELGTTTPLATYTDQAGTSPNTNPVILNAEGQAIIWIQERPYTFVVHNASDVLQSDGGDIYPASTSTINSLFFSTIAAMRAAVVANLIDGQVYQLKGYYTEGDGGGGLFIFNSGQSAGTYTDDNGITIVPTGGDGGAAWVRSYSGPVNVKWFGATGDGVTDDYSSIQAAITFGKSVFFPAGVYGIGTGLVSSVNGTVIKGEGEQSELKALAAVVMLTFSNGRRQVVEDMYINGNSLATYGVKCDYPKTGVTRCIVSYCTLAGVWLSYFSTYVNGRSQITSNLTTGILVKDGTGVVNDIRINDCVVQLNQGNGIHIDTPVIRSGIYLSNINMEQNATLASTHHVNVGVVRGFFATDMYHENGDPQDQAGNSFYNFLTGSTLVVIDHAYMSSSATVPFDYHILVPLAAIGYKFSNIRSRGYGTAMVFNYIASSDTESSLTLENIQLETGSRASIATGGPATTILPNTTALFARRDTTNQTISTDTTVVFNSALQGLTQAEIDKALTPAAYSITTGQYTCWETGYYMVSGQITAVALSSGIHLQVAVQKDGGDVDGPVYSGLGDGTKNVTVAFESVVSAVTGSVISIRARTNNGSSTELRVSATTLSIVKIGTRHGIAT